jgi:catechol 2,3-dioxygenase-like lactoylglutathione lyase family enzyme
VRVSRLDHLVLTVASIDATVSFYTQILGMTPVTFGAGRTALTFGTSKINLHEAGREFEPKALRPTPGSADLCFIVDEDIRDLVTELADAGIEIEAGPVERTGALGPIISCYLRDPDQNLIELSNYPN